MLLLCSWRATKSRAPSWQPLHCHRSSWYVPLSYLPGRAISQWCQQIKLIYLLLVLWSLTLQIILLLSVDLLMWQEMLLTVIKGRRQAPWPSCGWSSYKYWKKKRKVTYFKIVAMPEKWWKMSPRHYSYFCIILFDVVVLETYFKWDFTYFRMKGRGLRVNLFRNFSTNYFILKEIEFFKGGIILTNTWSKI